LERAVGAADRQPVTVVPKQAIVERNGAQAVFVVKDGRAVLTNVEGGRAIGDLVQVAGVAAGERVIVKPLERLTDGDRVKVAAK
ncbi:MAG: efflux RND transporter periplasmic adaptor subunit, partial [Burkholderiales bacterium]